MCEYTPLIFENNRNQMGNIKTRNAMEPYCMRLRWRHCEINLALPDLNVLCCTYTLLPGDTIFS